MYSRRASEQDVSLFDDPHPERLSPPDRRDVTPWQSFVGAGMSFGNLNNEDYFSDQPKRLTSLDALFRAQAQFSPEHFSAISSGNPATIIAANTITRGRYFCFGDCNPRAGSFRS
jgi:hypothetical protein